MGRQYTTSPSNGQHWLVEAGELEPGQGVWFNRVREPSLQVAGDYHSGYRLQIKDAGPALKAAYPDKIFEVVQHGSQFAVERRS
jgi:hypothetical protein